MLKTEVAPGNGPAAAAASFLAGGLALTYEALARLFCSNGFMESFFGAGFLKGTSD